MTRSRRRCLTAVFIVAVLQHACDASSPADLRLEELSSAVTFGSGAPASWARDPVEILRGAVAGDTLTLEVRYGGGCAEHRFQVVGQGSFQESWPVGLALILAHDAGDDPCDGLLQTTLRFDLTPVAERYRASYGASSGIVRLHLEGLAHALDYRF
ncbi:MAG: hypothetical protein R3E98_03780 [Gemmatimonadota bacterium]|nr:hypothetical protein [Gemmatimonadota bacterium]